MTEFEKIKGRCHIDSDTGCWHWRGGTSKGVPRIYATDYTLGEKTVQTGIRAVWHAITGEPIPDGWRVFHTRCTNQDCLNPAHLDCGPTADWGKQVAKSGQWKGQSARIKANRAIGRKKSKVTPELLTLIQGSNQTGLELSSQLGIGRSVISKAKRGQLVSIVSVGNPFAGLGA